MQNKLECFFEYKVVNAFVSYFNREHNHNFIYKCRPEIEDRSNPMPDFQYYDNGNNMNIFIELKRITTIDIEKYKQVKDIYSEVKENVDNKIHGSFLLIVDPLVDSITKMPRGTKREEKLKSIVEDILNHESRMMIEGKIKMNEGVELVKYSNSNSYISVEPMIKFDNPHEEGENLLELINDSNKKFHALDKHINILIVMLTSSICTEIKWLIEAYDILYPDASFSLSNINYIYEIEFNTDFDINPLGLSQCYPPGSMGNWCNHSDIFKSKRSYIKLINRYFLGF